MTLLGINADVTNVAITEEHIKDSNVFILDNGLTVYQWNALSANVHELRRDLEFFKDDILPEPDFQPQLTISDSEEIFKCEAL